MNDKKKLELWQQLVSKHTADAQAKALKDGSVSKETTPPTDPPTGDAPPATPPTEPVPDPLAPLIERITALETKLTEIGKAYDGAVAKAAEDRVALEQAVASVTTIAAGAEAAAKRIEELAPRGQGRRIDERLPVGKSAGDPPDDGALLAQRTAEVLNIGKK